MKLNSLKFGVACAAAFAVAWIICAGLVMIMPVGMMQMSGHMVHSDLSSMHWDMGIHGLLQGLVGWAVVAGFTGWLIALIYNKLI